MQLINVAGMNINFLNVQEVDNYGMELDLDSKFFTLTIHQTTPIDFVKLVKVECENHVSITSFSTILFSKRVFMY